LECETEKKREGQPATANQSSSSLKKKSNLKLNLTTNPTGQLAKGKVPSGIMSALGSDGNLLPAE